MVLNGSIPLSDRLIKEILLEELTFYLNGEQTLHEFYEWFILETIDNELWTGEPNQSLINKIKLCLYEYSTAKHCNWPIKEEDLKNNLRKVLDETV